MNAENSRLEEARTNKAPWKKWGPYLSERQWGTVREDYSESGDAWNYFTHDQARSRAYRWGEDGLAGISDDRQRLCFALALWNGKDPILKERLFGLSNSEGNHGEDVKECYFYLDSTPTHSYMKYLYKYPQAAFPYDDLVATNRDRGRGNPEYELLDTGVFEQDRYFDVFVEYAKASPEDMLIQITAHNRGPEPATLQLLPTLWFRNDWSWGEDVARSTLRQTAQDETGGIVTLSHRELGERFFFAESASALLFTENETNTERLAGTPNTFPYVKDGIDNFIVYGNKDAVNPENTGTKVSAHYPLTLGAGESRTIRLRLSDQPIKDASKEFGELFGKAFESLFKTRLQEADAFYATVIPASVNPDAAGVMRQALAGMLWSKQFFFYDVGRWLKQHGIQPYKANQRSVRNDRWGHMVNADVISMPDNMLILRALLQYYLYYGKSFTIECPTGSGKQMNLYEVAEEIGRRLSKIFLKDEQGKRPVHGTSRKFQEDPHWRDYPLFYEYFHGDTGAGVGASHQTGWSGGIARIMHLFASFEAHKILEGGKDAAMGEIPQPGRK